MNYQTLNGGSDISARIGALELGALNAVDDAALEATVQAGPSTFRPACPFIDDEGLECVAVQSSVGPTANPAFCYHIDAGALEASAVTAAGPGHTQPIVSCRMYIDDGALASAALSIGPQSTQMPYRGCFSIDDSALEATVHAGPQRPTAIRLPGGGCLPGIDDSALESTAASHLGPTGMTCPPPQTMRPICRYIDDSALEQTAAHIAAGPPPTSIRFPDGGCNGR